MINVKWYSADLIKEIKKRQLIALKMSGALLEGKIKKSMRPGHYRKYIRGKKARGTSSPGKVSITFQKSGYSYHWSSFPGNAPAVDTGRLRASITFQPSDGMGGTEPESPAKFDDGVSRPSAGRHESVCVVGTNVEYGLGLELGSGRTKPRPFLRPALEKNKRKILKIFKDILK